MKYKSNVSIKFLYPAMADLQNALELSSPESYEPTITSANDSNHSEKSLHYSDKAYDIRTMDFPFFKLNDFENTRFHVDKLIESIKIYLKNPD